MSPAESQTPPPSTKKLVLTGLLLTARFGQVGLLIAIPLLILVWLGAQLDKHFQTRPLFMFVGVALSLIPTSWEIWRLIKDLPKN